MQNIQISIPDLNWKKQGGKNIGTAALPLMLYTLIGRHPYSVIATAIS